MVIGNQGKVGILFLHPWTELYGSATSLYLLIKYLDRERFHPVVVLPDEGPLWNKLQELGVEVSISPLQCWLTYDDSATRMLRWLEDLPERVQRIADIVHHWDIKIVHSNVAEILEGALAATLTGRPHVCTVRNNRFAYPLRKSVISIASVHKMLSSMSHTIVPVSSAIKEALSPFVDPAKFRVIFNGADIESFHPQPFRSSSDATLPQAEHSREPRIISIGRVTDEKGFDLFIDAAALVVRAYPGARFSVFGPIHDKPLYQRLVEQVNRLKLADNLRFEGHTDNVQFHLSMADLLVGYSKAEGFSRVVYEAMAVGKPFVSTRCGGPEEAIVDGIAGYLVPPDNPQALTDAILMILKDPDHARQMGQKGLELVQRQFEARHTAKQYEALYHEVLKAEVERPSQDKNGEAVLVRALLEMLEKYGEEFYEMGSRSRRLKRFKAKVRKTLAYKAYKAMKNLAGKLR